MRELIRPRGIERFLHCALRREKLNILTNKLLSNDVQIFSVHPVLLTNVCLKGPKETHVKFIGTFDGSIAIFIVGI